MAKAAPKKKDVPATTGSKEVDPRSKTWFRPGQSGNPKGRPEGSKNKVTEDFLSKLAADFEQHGASAIREMREKDPGGYVRVVAQLVPSESKHEIKADDAFAKLWGLVASGAAASLVDLMEEADGKSVN